ncbi:hypothetical protein EGW08_023277, partial [Elysia chlorotica]
LKNIKRIVIKVGTSTLTHSTGLLNIYRIERLVRQLADLHNQNYEVILVTSGAVGAGMGKLGLQQKPKTLPEKQAVAAVGQVALTHLYQKLFSEYGKNIAQLLLTKDDIANRERYLNARNAFSALLEKGVIPVVNENDAVVIDEIKVGDNDTLSALVANLINADLLIILSDIDGLYTANPRVDSNAKLLGVITEISDDIRAMAGDVGSKFGTGGMATKIKAAEIALAGGVNMIIASGEDPVIISNIVSGQDIGTLFLRSNKKEMCISILEMGKKAKKAAKELAQANTQLKNNVLYRLESALLDNVDYLLEQNQKDLEIAKQNNLSKAFVDRLTLNQSRIESMANGVRQIADFADPVGKIEKGFKHPNGMTISQVRVPLGVIAMIFESRPNVTIDAGALALKSGNAIILRGGSDALYTNIALKNIFQDVCKQAGLSEYTVQLVEDISRERVTELVTLDKYVDVIIPRGGKSLKKAIQQQATIPMIETGAGICHTYVDEFADIEKAIKIVINAKTQRPGVCNALETLLVHKNIAEKFLPLIEVELAKYTVELKADSQSLKYLNNAQLATTEDWDTEYLDLVLSIKTVANINEAIEHINTHGSMHSECIVTESYTNTEIFLNEVDAAAVYANASTRFTDGSEFGFGGEIGISTQKLHARGPMGISELTTLKYIIRGNGQV